MSNTMKTIDEILAKIECYMWPEDDEPTIDVTTIFSAKQAILALIATEKKELLEYLKTSDPRYTHEALKDILIELNDELGINVTNKE